LALGPHAPQHLVSDLNQIAGIEEITVDKSRISNVLGMRIGGAAFLKGTKLGVWLGWATNHGKYNYVHQQSRVNPAFSR
jgi:hypothetical protein